jgi:hypothetical protein
MDLQSSLVYIIPYINVSIYPINGFAGVIGFQYGSLPAPLGISSF